MPAAVLQFTSLNRNGLKNALQAKSGISLVDTYSCKLLSELIYTATGELVNYNTLRRVLGIINSVGAPSDYTLSVLAKFLGFPDWQGYRNWEEQLDNERFLIKSQLVTGFGKYEMRWIKDFKDQLTFRNWIEFFQLKSLVDAAIQHRDQELLLLITDLNIQDSDPLVFQRLFMSFESVIWKSQRSEKDYWEWIGEVLLRRPVFRQVILELYVNENALEGYFGYWLNLPYSVVSKEFTVFRRLLNGQLEVTSNQDDTLFKEFIQSTIQGNDWKEFHPIIKGRLAAWSYILDITDISAEELFAECKADSDKIAFISFYYRLIWLIKGINSPIALNWKSLHRPRGLLSTFEYVDWNNYFTIQAINARLAGDRECCQSFISKVDPYLFSSDYFEWFKVHYDACREFAQAT